jgi:hypothetical protein
MGAKTCGDLGRAAEAAASEATKKESAAPKTESATPPLSAPASPVIDKQR